MTALWMIVLCGVLSIVYAIWATASVMKADAGNPRMQEIAAAVREGAQAYLKRQYMTIGIVGIVIFALARPTSSACWSRSASLVGAVLSGRGRLHRHERLGARQRPYRAGGDEIAGRRT